jgi:hypothetical protein
MCADVLQYGDPRWPRGRIAGLLGFVLAVVLVSDLPVVHAHEAPGLYDEDCPLEQLAAAAPHIALPTVPDVPSPTPAPDPVPTVRVTASVSVPFASFASRAPPVLVPCRTLAP